jgi:hypothetical protein
MPDLTSQTSLLRAGRFRYTGDLNYVPRVVVFSRAVNTTAYPIPTKFIPYDDPYSGVGAFTDVREDMTILFYHQNTSTLKGIGRVAYGGATSSLIQVNEVSRGTLSILDNDRFDVVEEYDLWDKLVSNTATFDKDSRRTYVDEGDDPPPVANSGGPVVGTVDPATGELLVDFPGDTSFRVDPDAGTLDHDWQFGADATPTDSTDENPAGVSIPEGFRFVYHRGDDSNGAFDLQAVPVWANGPNFPPLKVRLRQRRYTPLGWGATLEVPRESAALSVLHEHAFVVYSESEQRGTTTGSLGANVAGRSHVKVAGYLDRTSIRMNADETVIAFDVISPLAMLEKTGALPQLLVRGGAGWTNVKELHFWRALWYILYWGSTAKLSHDFLWPNGQSFAYERLEVADDSSILGQLRDIAGSIKVDVTCDMLGRILLIRNPNYLSLTDRDARTVTYALGPADYREVEFEMEHRLRYKFVRGEALTAAATVAQQAALYADAPGPAPGPGTQVATLSRQVVTDQWELVQRTDDELAYLNGTYMDPTTKAVRKVPKGVLVSLADGYDVFDPALREFVTFSLDTGRYVYDDSTRWLIEEMTISYDDNGGKDIQAVISHETRGEGGTPFFPPQYAASELPSISLILPDYGTLTALPTALLTAETERLWHIMYRDHSAGEASLVTTEDSYLNEDEFTYASLGINGVHAAAQQDPFQPSRLWVVTDQEIGIISDIAGTPAYAVGGGDATDLGLAVGDVVNTIWMHTNIAAQNFVFAAVWATNGATQKVYFLTTRDGVTYTSTLHSSNGWNTPVWVSAHKAGRVFIGEFTGTTWQIARSENYGASWTVLPNIPNLDILGFHFPYHNNADDGFFYFTVDNGPAASFYEYDHGTVTLLDGVVPNTTSGNEQIGGIGLRGIDTYSSNRNLMAMIGLRFGHGLPDGWALDDIAGGYTYSDDGGASWLPQPTVGTTYMRSIAISGNNPLVRWGWGASGQVWKTIDGVNLSVIRGPEVAALMDNGIVDFGGLP